jgi:diphosphomevalonate decarboxylase
MNNKQMQVKYSCPSNIALVKYWGKKEGGVQLPANASISWSLSDLFAETSMIATQEEAPKLIFTFKGEPKPSFEPKIKAFLERISQYSDFVKTHNFTVDTVNNFPHGTGIASSAAGFGALAMCIADLEGKYVNGSAEFFERASFFARLGSGSACRSVYGKPAVWGEHSEVENSSDLHAVPFEKEIHQSLSNWKDCVLIVDDGEKKVSSSAGHALLENHPYAAARFANAQKNIGKITTYLQSGDVSNFIALVESEALQLHSMMMSSIPYFTLIRPNTLAILEEIWSFREETKLPLAFTLDAGANVHLLYDKQYETEISNFIDNKLLVYCKNGTYLCSNIGGTPQKLT